MAKTNALLQAVRGFAENDPNRLAYRVEGEADTTYGQLWERAGRVAQALLARTSGREPIIVLGGKSNLTVASFLGCLLSGHAFVPVDAWLPAQRIQTIVSQIEDTLVLATAEVPEELYDLVPRESIVDVRPIAKGTAMGTASGEDQHGMDAGVEVDTPTASGASTATASAASAVPDESQWVTGEETQYIIFTSGSTGRPKGIQVTADNVANFMGWVRTFPQVREGGRVFLDQAPYSFDLSEYQLVGALSTGGQLFALDNRTAKNHPALFRELGRSGVQVWVSTPSFADFCLVDQSFAESLLPEARLFLFCGEALHHTTASALRDRFPRATIANTYGPTESTVAVTYTEIGPTELADPAPLPVGRPRPGTELRIVDRATGREAAPGEQGEIIIVGDTVTKGYYRNPEKTQAAFFETSMADGTPVRAYRTGDLGTLDAEGALHVAGRIDSYIKLNGFRIELDEIEGTLEALPCVREAAVIPVKKDGRIKFLRAFVVLEGHDPENAFAEGRAVKAELAQRLPEYMVPRSVKSIDAMPLNANGKIDRKALAQR